MINANIIEIYVKYINGYGFSISEKRSYIMRLDGGDINNGQRILLISPKYGEITRLHINYIGNTLEDALYDSNYLISTLTIKSLTDRWKYTFEGVECEFKFHENIFVVIEALSNSILKWIIKVKGIHKPEYACMSDVHGDILLLLIPFYLTRCITRLEYNDSKGIIQFHIPRENGHVIFVGDLFTADQFEKRTPYIRIREYQSKVLFPMMRDLVNPFIKRFITAVLHSNIEFTFVIGNHDGQLYNRSLSIIFDDTNEEISFRDFISLIYIHYQFSEVYNDKLLSFSFTHGILKDKLIVKDYSSGVGNDLVITPIIDQSGSLLIPSLRDGIILYPDWFISKSIDDKAITKLITDETKYMTSNMSHSSKTFDKVIHIPILGHNSDYNLLLSRDRDLKLPRELQFSMVMSERCSENWIPSGNILENLLCLDYDDNSLIVSEVNNARKYLSEIRNELLPSRHVIKKVFGIKRLVPFTGGTSSRNWLMILLLLISILVLILELNEWKWLHSLNNTLLFPENHNQ